VWLEKETDLIYEGIATHVAKNGDFADTAVKKLT